jgi:Uma2 family endonuclease
MDFADTLTLKGLERLTDDEFFHFCQQNRDLRIERTCQGEVIIMSPTGTRSGERSGAVFGRLFIWNEQHQAGHVFDSSTGFTLPDGSVLSPDASWVSHEQWSALSREEREKFAPICPEFVVELKSPSDLLPTLRDKMEVWMSNGCRLGWLIYPELETVFIYRADGSRAELHDFGRRVSGEDVLPGFELELAALR